VVVVVVIFSVAYVLITPDLTDDVDGLLRSNYRAKTPRPLAVSLQHSHIPVIALFRLFKASTCARRLASLELLDLVCVSRC